MLAALALTLLGTGAKAIVGGAEETGSLARTSVMVLSSNGGVCSAVVVAHDVVLTAAHCAADGLEHRVHFRSAAGEPVLIAPTAKAIHPGYDAKAIEMRRRSIDLALIRIPDPLPTHFETAALSSQAPPKDSAVTVGGYGIAREKDAKSTGTFRTVALKAIEPYGPSRILLWAQGAGATGACYGDSGGPITAGGAVVAITSWSRGEKGHSCGEITQGILLSPQRTWIDQTMATWGRSARWE